MNWKDAPKTTKIQAEEGYMWVGFSPMANGLRFGSPECDDFLQFNCNLYEKEGWLLVAYCISLSQERINLRFKDTREKEFSCKIAGKFKGNIDADKLARLLARLGIDAKIEAFELCQK